MGQQVGIGSLAGALLPGDEGYDAARSLFNGSIDRRPALIAQCASAEQVAAAVRYGREAGLEIGVRGGGHGYWGAAAPEDGLMIHLGGLRRVSVDPAARLVRCGGGATQADLDAATQAHGLAVTGGTISHTGVGGLALGGGMGWLTRSCGLTADNLVAAQVVLADGRIVRTDAEQHPDLRWALTGGGGNFGVVTEITFRLFPVGPSVQLGLTFWELARAEEALRVAADLVAGLPREAGALIVALNAPPAPFVPPEHHFAPGIALLLVGLSAAGRHAGWQAAASGALPPLFAFSTELPYVAVQRMLDESAPWGVHAYSKALYLDGLDDAVAGAIAAALPGRRSPMSLIPIFPLGGAFTDRTEGETAFGGPRSAGYVVNIEAVALDPDAFAADRAWVRELSAELAPLASNTGGYLNFLAEPDPDRVRTSYGPATYARLAQVKATYDPDNTFHRNANITPAPDRPRAAVPAQPI